MYGSGPYCAAPYCEPYDGASAAVASPITALLAGNLHVLFEHLLWLQPYDPISQSLVDIFLCSGANGIWYKTGADETFPTGEPCAHQKFLGHLLQPPNRETRILSSGEVNEGPSSYGACVVADPRRRFIRWLSYQWKNAKARHFMGDPRWPLATMAEVFHGVATGLDPSEAALQIGLQDVVAKLQSTDYQTKLYAGRGSCVRLNGATGYLPGTVPCPAGSMTIGLRVRVRTSITAQGDAANWRNGTAAGLRRIRVGPTNAVLFDIRSDAGTNFIAASASGVLAPLKWFDLWGVLDLAAGRISLFSGADPDNPLAQVAVSGTFATVLSAFAVGRQADGAANFFPGDVDEVTVWSHALTSVEIAKWTTQRPPAGTAGLLYQWSMTEATRATAFESVSGFVGPNLTLTGGATWVDSLTGGPELQGKAIPKGRGIRREVSPVLLSSIDLIYQVAETFDHLATDVLGPVLKDGGVRVWTLLGTYTDPWAATPATGQYMEIPSLGLIRLGSAPVRQLTCAVYLTAAADLPSCLTGILLGDGVLDSTEVNEGAVASLPATQGVGYLSGLDRIKVDAVLIKYLASVKGWRAPDRMGALSFGVISPPEDLTPEEYVTADAFVLDSIKPGPTLPAARSAVIKYQPYGTTQQFTSTNPTLTEAARQDLGEDFRAVSSADNLKIIAADATAPVAFRGGSGETCLDTVVDAQAEVDLEAEWRSVARRPDTLQLSEPVPRFVVGQIINIKAAFLDYDRGKNVIVSATIADDGRGQHSIEVIGAVMQVGGDDLLVQASTGDALQVGDGTGTIQI